MDDLDFFQSNKARFFNCFYGAEEEKQIFRQYIEISEDDLEKIGHLYPLNDMLIIFQEKILHIQKYMTVDNKKAWVLEENFTEEESNDYDFLEDIASEMILDFEIFKKTYYLFFLEVFNLNSKICSFIKKIQYSYFDFLYFFTKKNILLLALFFKYYWLFLFQICIDIICFDKPGKKLRFSLIYYLLSLAYNMRLKILTQISSLSFIFSINSIFSSTIWSEREIWDLYGILFYRHLNLRRILTDYGFEGFPLRKDFPLTGYKEIIYSDLKKRIEYVKLEINQEFRNLFFLRRWFFKENIYNKKLTKIEG